ncbi:hypothetical protein E7811_13015 [Aliigemmobacter aestuarii]|uniref:Uncharacterized protein n=1 Tax=Aliigemmobacter aestuarii TaxID=1445661 RepID=A0A4S3MLG4_9RHOB|nr:DUF6477 family protein [Gemmobacter aestuarii]THD83054.1 hypothetical protein E7811_13015 [Gemmobacter aestuarii]
MTQFRTLLNDLRRPGLLIRAARIGLSDYRRDRDLRRLIGLGGSEGPEATLPRLLAEEARLEAERTGGEAGYSLCRHIDILIALLAEMRLLPRDQTPA